MKFFCTCYLFLCAPLGAAAWMTTTTTTPRRRVTTRTTRLLAASSSSTKTASRSVANLLDWAESVGIQTSPVLALAQDPVTGFGWQTTTTTTSSSKSSSGVVVVVDAANQVLLQVPTAMALTVTAGQGPDDSRVVRQAPDRRAFRDLPWYAQYAAYLHVLQTTGTKGDAAAALDMKPWLASLPVTLDTPLHWTDAEIQELQYDFMTKAVAKQREAWKEHYKSLQQNGFANLSYEDFIWGCEMARSRAFSGAGTGSAFNPSVYAFTLILVAAYVGLGLGTIEQAANGAGVVFCATILKDFVLPKLFKSTTYVICPLIDMCNHESTGAAANVAFEYFGNAYSLASTKAVAADSAVCISYGARSNDQWLQYYGFVETNCPADVYLLPPLREWPLEAMEKAVGRTVAAGRLQALERAGLLGYSTAPNDDDNSNSNKPLFDENAANADGGVVVTRTAGLDPAVWQALRALFCTDAEWQAAGQAVGSFAASAPTATTETAVRAAAKCALEWELTRKDTTLEEDVALWQRLSKKSKAVDVSPAETLALQFRIEKKKVLHECLKNMA